MDTKCCDGSVSKATGIPKSAIKSGARLEMFDGTAQSSFEGKREDLKELNGF